MSPVDLRLAPFTTRIVAANYDGGKSGTTEVEVRTSLRMPRVFSRPSAGSRMARAAVRAGVATAGLAGALGAVGMTLRHQARVATILIESAARTAEAPQSSTSDAADSGDQNPDPPHARDAPAPPSPTPAAAALAGADSTVGTGAGALHSFEWHMLLPSGDGIYRPDGTGPRDDDRNARSSDPASTGTVTLTMLGDSTAVGYGCHRTDEKPGAVFAGTAARELGMPIRLTTHGVIGSRSADLDRQVDEALPDRPTIAVILVGANDVRDGVPPRRSARELGSAVRKLRSNGVLVVVGTCPDLGVIAPIAQPLRRIAGVWSRILATRQERQVHRAGGVPVPLGKLASPDFYGRPDLFYVDGFHPNGLGYAKAAAVMMPDVIAVLRSAEPVAGRRSAAESAPTAVQPQALPQSR